MQRTLKRQDLIFFCDYAKINQMYVFFLALRNVISRKSSVVIILFIAFAIALLFTSNAVFDGTDSGMERTFINSFTGNIVICPKTEFPLSLFGDETPVTGELSQIPSLIPYSQIVEQTQGVKGISSLTPQISGAAVMNINNTRLPFSLFGVEGGSYVKLMSSIKIEKGEPYAEGKPGLMLSTDALSVINDVTGIHLALGDSIQLLTTDGTSFSIRSVPLTAIYSYESKNQTLSRIALVSPQTLRDLCGMQDYSEDVNIQDSQMNLIEEESSIDDLFSSSSDFALDETEGGPELELFSAAEKQAAPVKSSVWSYIICKTDGSVKDKKVIRSLNRLFKEKGWNVQAVNWRGAAGGSVYISFYLRLIFNIGIVMVLLTGFIVVNNTLTVSSISRICETGTIRALGGKRGFVISEFLFETSFLTIISGFFGCILGSLIVFAVTKAHIALSNTYLSQLFGGSTLEAALTSSNFLQCMALSVVLALAGCVYPVKTALEASPVEAMRGQM